MVLNFLAIFVLSVGITSLLDKDLIMISGYVFTFLVINAILTFIFSDEVKKDEE